MTKDQLVESFNEANIVMASGDLTWGSWLTIILGAILLLILFIKEDVNMVFVPFVIIGVILIVSAIQNSPNRGYHTPEDYEASLEKWKVEQFDEHYVKEQPKERFEIEEYTLTPEGQVVVSLDTDKKKSIVKDIEDVEYIDLGSPYLEAVWVEGLVEYGIDDGFYGAKAYIQRK